MDVKFRDIPGRIYLRYLLLTIPGVVILMLVLMIVEHWVAMPSWLFWTVIFLWLAKEVAIFPFVWRAHDSQRPGISRSMIGAFGIVKERLDPAGYIQVKQSVLRPRSQLKRENECGLLKWKGLSCLSP
jgi:membrane protein implicated in regulation of membrane protease activity